MKYRPPRSVFPDAVHPAWPAVAGAPLSAWLAGGTPRRAAEAEASAFLHPLHCSGHDRRAERSSSSGSWPREPRRALRPAGAMDALARGLACLVTAARPPHSAALGANLRVPPAMHPPLAGRRKERLLLAVVTRRRRRSATARCPSPWRPQPCAPPRAPRPGDSRSHHGIPSPMSCSGVSS